MKLHIPEQHPPASDAFDNNPRKVKKWLSELPLANMGELTKQVFTRLREINRQTMPNKHRLENMEMLRAPTRSIFDNLNKYFINRTLPLPEKSQKIVNLNQSLLREMSFGYEIIISEAANGIDRKIDARTAGLCALRAIRYHAEMLLRASEIYETLPSGTWVDTHRIYAYAESLKVQDVSFPDREYAPGKASISEFYRQMMLFALSRPMALRQSDSERLYKKLSEWSRLTRIGSEPNLNHVNRFFCSRLEDDRPPGYLTERDCEPGQKICTLDTTELVDHLQKEISEKQRSKTHKFAVGDEMSVETLQVLAMSWGICAKRRFSRAGRNGHIEAAIGLSHAAEMIANESQRKAIEEKKQEKKKEDDVKFSLQAIPEDFKDMESELSTGYITHTELGRDDNGAWEMVARGRALTDTYERERKIESDDQLRLGKDNEDKHWELVNVSAGGYCLRWNSDTTSKAQIGELIGLREREPSGNYAWRIGVIRWMQFTHENGLEIGIQVLSPKVMAASALRASRRDEDPFDCLMLPGIRAINQSPSILLPAHAFQTGNLLEVTVMEQLLSIKLGSVKEHTGLFTQFQFESHQQAQERIKAEKKEDAAKKKDDFDEIWSSL